MIADQIFNDPNQTHLVVTWGTGLSQIRITGHVTNLAKVRPLLSPPISVAIAKPALPDMR